MLAPGQWRNPAAVMKRRAPCHLAIVAAAALSALPARPAYAQEACKLTAIGTATVAAVRDGRTLLLADGRELRLAGIEVTDDSRAALQALVVGHPLRLAKLGPDRDRYGRLVAFAFAGDANAIRAAGAARRKAARGSRRGSATRPAPTRF